jgi:hypothetical protein
MQLLAAFGPLVLLRGSGCFSVDRLRAVPGFHCSDASTMLFIKRIIGQLHLSFMPYVCATA